MHFHQNFLMRCHPLSRAPVPYYYLFSRDFNFTNLEWNYFTGLEFSDIDELAFFKVIKFRESANWHGALFVNFHFCTVYLTITE